MLKLTIGTLNVETWAMFLPDVCLGQNYAPYKVKCVKSMILHQKSEKIMCKMYYFDQMVK